jgi:glycosyltransferase involved in cell wall biosynthesis
MPEISVVIPAYNAERYLALTVESVCAQTLTSWELIIVNDGSSDRTMVIAEQFAARDERIRVRQQTNAGVAAARNAGLSAAHRSASSIMFLDADDILSPDALETLAAALQAQPSAVGAHGQVQFIASDGRSIRPGEAEAWGRQRRALVNGKIVDWPLGCPTTLSVLILLNRMRTPGCVLLRRELVELIGGFDPDPRLAIAEDYGLWLRLACRGDFAFVDQVVLSYRLHEQNSSGDLRKTDARVRYALRKLARAQDINEEQRQLIKHGSRYSRLLGSKNWFAWAKKSLAHGDIRRAANQGRHAFGELLHFYFDRPV